MISILLATGFEKLDNTLEKFFAKDTTIEFSKQRVYFREGLSDTIIRTQPDVILMSDKLDGNTLSLEQVIKLTRKRHSEKRIVFILTDKENVRLLRLLYQLSVFDVFTIDPKLNIKEMYDSFLHPKMWKDVADKFPDLDEESYEIDEEFILNSKDGLIVEDEYSTFDTTFKNTIPASLRANAAFWSVRQQSGSTFLTVNTGILLAQHSDQKILIADFNANNPNVHIQFRLNDPDGNRNLGALCEDIYTQSALKSSDIDDYLITHPFYKNMRVMLGLILKDKKPDQETLIKAFDLVVDYAEKEGYTSVLFDIESGLEELYIVHILKNVDVVINPINETPGSIIATQKIYDREFGPFFLNFLDLKKFHPILNKSYLDDNTPKMQQILQSTISKKIDVIIPRDQKVYESIQIASPILKKQCPPSLLRPLTMTANYIHNIFEVMPEDKKDKKKFGLF
ncbi:hypothetical protein [Priestia aryabhattai]